MDIVHQDLKNKVCRRETFASHYTNRKRGKSARASPTQHHTSHEERTARFTAQHLSALKDSDICPLCNYESQSLLHMLFTCNISYTFWNLFTRWLPKTFQEHINLSESVILYGWHKKSNNWPALNYALIIAKYHIFCTSVCNGILNFESFLLRLKNKISVMRKLAVANNKLEQFLKSWAPVFL